MFQWKRVKTNKNRVCFLRKRPAEGVRSFTEIDWITGMDYRNGLLYVTLSACDAFYMHRMAYKGLPYPTLPYHTLLYPTLPYPTILPYHPTIPYPTLQTCQAFLLKRNTILDSGCEVLVRILQFSRDQRYLILISRIWRFLWWNVADFCIRRKQGNSAWISQIPLGLSRHVSA